MRFGLIECRAGGIVGQVLCERVLVIAVTVIDERAGRTVLGARLDVRNAAIIARHIRLPLARAARRPGC